MSRYKPATPHPSWQRPMAGWWRRRSAHRWYMLREVSALFIAAEALLLLAGLLCPQRGEAAFAAWRAVLGSPWSIGLHALALPFVAYHAITWFQVMPKTAPALPIAPRWITLGGLALLLFHAHHRLLHSLHDLGWPTGRWAQLVFYGTATLGSVLAAVLLVAIRA
jgi:fumarate reductase subunit C